MARTRCINFSSYTLEEVREGSQLVACRIRLHNPDIAGGRGFRRRTQRKAHDFGLNFCPERGNRNAFFLTDRGKDRKRWAGDPFLDRAHRLAKFIAHLGEEGLPLETASAAA